MKADQERVKNLLTDTVTLLCKNGLLFSDELRIEGLLGVTVDNKDAFFVHISEKFGTGAESENSEDSNLSVKKSKKSKVHQDSPASPKSVPSRPSSSASSHAASPRHHPAPNVKIKRERDDDDLIMVDSKPSCMMSQPRVPPTHGGPVFPGLESQGANFRQFPLSNQSHSKRQKVNNQPFVTGMARHVNEPNSDNSASNPWQNLASQVGGGRAGQSDAQIAPWPSPGGSQLGMQSGNPDMWRSTVDHRPTNKGFSCNYPGCTKSFRHMPNLCRHKRHSHGLGRKPVTHFIPQTAVPDFVPVSTGALPGMTGTVTSTEDSHVKRQSQSFTESSEEEVLNRDRQDSEKGDISPKGDKTVQTQHGEIVFPQLEIQTKQCNKIVPDSKHLKETEVLKRESAQKNNEHLPAEEKGNNEKGCEVKKELDSDIDESDLVIDMSNMDEIMESSLRSHEKTVEERGDQQVIKQWDKTDTHVIHENKE